MDKRIRNILIIFGVINVISLLLVLIFYNSDGFVGDYVKGAYFLREDRYADFYNPAWYAMDKRLIDNEWTNSPPFLHFCGYVTSLIAEKVVPNGFSQGVAFWISPIGCIIWLSIVLVVSIIICILCKNLFKMKKSILITIFIVLLSYPYLYTIDRGNYVLVALMFICLFITSYEKKSKWSSLWLGIAASFKLYPALLGIIYLRDRKWKDALISVGVFLCLTIFSLLFFSGHNHLFFVTLFDWINKVKSYSIIGNNIVYSLITSTSMKSFFMAISYKLFPTDAVNVLVDSVSWFTIPNYIFLVFILVSCLFFKKNHDIYLLLSLEMVIFPAESGIYNLILIIIPLLYWIFKENNNYFILICGLFVLISKTDKLVSFINPVCIFIMMCYIIFLRRNEYKKIFVHK